MHWTLKLVISCIRLSPTGGNFFFAVVKFFEYNNAISANFVQTVKNSSGSVHTGKIHQIGHTPEKIHLEAYISNQYI